MVVMKAASMVYCWVALRVVLKAVLKAGRMVVMLADLKDEYLVDD